MAYVIATPNKPSQNLATKIPSELVSVKQTATTTTTTLPPTTTTTAPKPVITAPKASTLVQTYTPTGDWVAQCHAWATQAGVTLTPSAITILDRESDCNPQAQNPTSSACGIAQNIRGCGSDGYGHDPISQIKWFYDYCVGRYGGFDQAYQFWLNNHWY